MLQKGLQTSARKIKEYKNLVGTIRIKCDETREIILWKT